MVNYSKIIMKNTVLAVLFTFLATISSYLFRILLANKLSLSNYGLFFSILSFFMLLNLFVELGLSKAVAKKIVELNVEKKFKSIKNLLFSVFMFQLVLVFILFVPLFFFSSFFMNLFFHSSNSILFIFMLLWFVLTPFRVFISAIYFGFKQLNSLSVYNFLSQFLLLLLAFIIFSLGFSSAPYLAYVFSTIILVVGYFFPIKLFFKDFFNFKFRFDVKLLKKTLVYGLLISVVSFATLILTQSDTLMISFFKGTELAGLYQVAVPASVLITFFVSPLMLVSFPYIIEFFKKKDFTRLNSGMSSLYKYVLIISMPLAILLFTFPEFIISTLFGSKFLGAVLSLRILSLTALFSVILSLNNNALIATNHAKQITKYTLGLVGFNILFNLIMIPLFDIVGASITTFVSTILAFLISSFYVHKYLKVSFPIRSWSILLVIGIITSILVIKLKELILVTPLVKIIILALIAGVFYVGSLFITKLVTFSELKTYLKFKF